MNNLIKSLALFELCVITFTSCVSKEESSPFKNTTWTYVDSFWEDSYHIKFMDDNAVMCWRNSEQKYLGTYSVDGDHITFHDLYDGSMGHRYIDGKLTSPYYLEVNKYSSYSKKKLTSTYIKE